MVKNIVEHQFNITKHERKKLNKHQSFLIWFTGLSGSGKSTIANALEIELYKQGISTYLLDGDNIRFGINKDLSFSPEDRTENIRRIAEVANLFIDAGVVTLASFVSPYKIDRENIKSIVGQENFVEVYVSTSLEECERRDVKGLYQKARKGEIPNMTGISSPYEPPEAPSLIVDTEKESVKKSVNRILELIKLKLNG
ncbi:MAG: adenylyl-sulfate kinase [Flavobacteriales bacterium]